MGLREGEEGSPRWMDSTFSLLHLAGLDCKLHQRPGHASRAGDGPSTKMALQTALLGLFGFLVSVHLLVVLDGLHLLLAPSPLSLPQLICIAAAPASSPGPP